MTDDQPDAVPQDSPPAGFAASVIPMGSNTDSDTDSGSADAADDGSMPETIHFEPTDDDATVIGPDPVAKSAPSSASDKTTRFGDYELIEEIARGGMGVVFRARQIKLNRIVALKMILAGQLASADEVRRFYAEAESAARLDHPGIVPIYEVGEISGQHFFSMGFVDGRSLASKLREGPLPPREAAAKLQTIADAIQFAHEHGVVHRDLKPQNILLTSEGHPKVADFGLAKTQAADHSLTASGQVLGTPGYMPPEQASGNLKEVGPLSDVYSLGAILYCLLTGRPPFQSANVLDTLKQVIDRDPVSPRLLNPSVDRDLETICLKCLSKSPGQRLSSAHELSLELGRFLRGEPIQSRRVTALTRIWRWCHRNPLGTALAGSFMAVLILVGVTGWMFQESSRTRQLAQFSSQFESLLDHPTLEASYMDQGDTLLAAMRALAPERVPEDLVRLQQVYARTVEAGIRRFKISTEEEQKIQAALVRLEAVNPLEVERLRQLLNGRLRTWLPLFELESPFSNVSAVFAGSATVLREGKVFREFTPGSAVQFDAAVQYPVLAAMDTTYGNVRLDSRPLCELTAVALNPDGTQFATGGQDGVIRVYSLPDQKLIAAFPGHVGLIRSLSWNNDGTWLISGGTDQSARLHYVADRRPGAVFQIGKGAIAAAVSGPGSAAVTTASIYGDNGICIWSLGGCPLLTLRPGHPVTELAWSPAGNQLAVGGHEQLQIWSRSGSKQRDLPSHRQSITSLAWNHGGSILASGSAEGTVGLWDSATGESQSLPPGKGNSVRGLAWSPSGNELAIGSAGGVLTLHDRHSGQEVWHRSLPRSIESAKWSADGNEIRLIAGSPGHTMVIAADGSDTQLTDWHLTTITHAVPNHTASRVLVGQINPYLAEIWSSTGRFLVALDGQVDSRRSQIAWSPDGRWIAAPRLNSTAVDIFDTTTGSLHATVSDLQKWWCRLAWREDSSSLAVGSGTEIHCWNAADGSIEILANLPEDLRAMDWQPGTDHLAVLLKGDRKSLHIWDAKTRQPSPAFRLPIDCVPNDFRWRPDGRQLAVCSEDSRIWIVDSEGQAVTTLAGHRALINDVAWSHNQNRIASTSEDGICRIWNADGALVAEFGELPTINPQVAWTADDSRIAFWSQDQSLRFLHPETGHQLTTVAFLPDHQSIVFGAGGHAVHATSQAWDHLTCLQETATGEIELSTPHEFYKRLQLPLPQFSE